MERTSNKKVLMVAGVVAATRRLLKNRQKQRRRKIAVITSAGLLTTVTLGALAKVLMNYELRARIAARFKGRKEQDLDPRDEILIPEPVSQH
ncbi:MAG: hypothetical protein ABR507_08860 [Actinomycetota bacterium]|nr:hypothetical protein [Actinomycetota bacterium]